MTAPADPTRVTCHCGGVELSVLLEGALDHAWKCDCSMCRRRGAPCASVPEAAVTVIKGDTLKRYRFGTKTAEYFFCDVCGVHTHGRTRNRPTHFGINTGAIDGLSPRDVHASWYDGVNHPKDQRGDG
ncbi:MAG: GFA family protein [Pseudomonadota bacterium]